MRLAEIGCVDSSVVPRTRAFHGVALGRNTDCGSGVPGKRRIEGFEGAVDNMHVRMDRIGHMGMRMGSDEAKGIRGLGRFAKRALLSLVGCLMLSAQADAFEAFDGRVELHGNYEMQLRAISAGFGED